MLEIRNHFVIPQLKMAEMSSLLITYFSCIFLPFLRMFKNVFFSPSFVK